MEMNVTSPCEFHCSCCWVCLHKRKEKKPRKHLHKVNQDTATRGAWFLQMWERFLHKEAIGENTVYSEASAFLTLAEFPYSVLLPCLKPRIHGPSQTRPSFRTASPAFLCSEDPCSDRLQDFQMHQILTNGVKDTMVQASTHETEYAEMIPFWLLQLGWGRVGLRIKVWRKRKANFPLGNSRPLEP